MPGRCWPGAEAALPRNTPAHIRREAPVRRAVGGVAVLRLERALAPHVLAKPGAVPATSGAAGDVPESCWTPLPGQPRAEAGSFSSPAPG